MLDSLCYNDWQDSSVFSGLWLIRLPITGAGRLRRSNLVFRVLQRKFLSWEKIKPDQQSFKSIFLSANLFTNILLGPTHCVIHKIRGALVEMGVWTILPLTCLAPLRQQLLQSPVPSYPAPSFRGTRIRESPVWPPLIHTTWVPFQISWFWNYAILLAWSKALWTSTWPQEQFRWNRRSGSVGA